MEEAQLVALLKQSDLVFNNDGYEYRIKLTCNDSVIYFYHNHNRNYDYFDTNKPSGYNDLVRMLSHLTRFEKRIGSDYFPIWTIEEGEIVQTQNFVKLKGKYYTINFLEQLIDKVIEFKKINVVS